MHLEQTDQEETKIPGILWLDHGCLAELVSMSTPDEMKDCSASAIQSNTVTLNYTEGN